MTAAPLETSAFAFASDLADEGVDTVLSNLQERAGLGGITPAFSYHAARDVFPHNPRRKVLLRPRGQLYFPPDLGLYGRLQPRVDPEALERDVLAETCRAASARGMRVDAWTIFLHADRPDEHQDCVTVNAFGNRFPADLCPASPDVREYTRALVADVCRYDIGSLFAESVHYHPVEHGHEHERYLIELGATARYLLGLCFCDHCLARAAAAGVDGAGLRAAVRAELERAFASRDAVASAELERDAVAGIAAELNAYLDVRADTVTTLAAEAAEVADAAGKRFVFMDPSGAVKGYWTGKPEGGPAAEIGWRLGIDLPALAAACPEVMVLGYAADVERVRLDLEAYRSILADATLSVALRPCPPDCETAENLAAKVALARELGLTWAGIYHYGFLRLEALDLVRAALARETRTVTRFDLLIRGGDVVDPGGGSEGRLDVAIEGDRIAAVDRDIPAESAAEAIDATGQIVTPGLVDLHTHVFHKVTYWGIDPDPVGSRSGVTTWNDAGSAGALTLPGLREFVVERARVRISAFLNISNIGLVGENHECANLAYLDVDLFRRLADGNRDLVRGVKVRMGTPTVGEHGLEPLRLARRAAEECELPLMVHIAFGPPEVHEVLELMRPGDILTHCFTGLTMKIVDDEGRLHESARRAWDAGVVMDIGHGTGSFAYETAEALMAAGRTPDVISTDLHQLSINGPAYDLPTVMSKFLHLGLSMRDVVRATTSRPAELLGLDAEAGTLRPGSLADVALFRLLPGRFPLYDIWGEVREADALLVNTGTIVGGRPLEPLPPQAPAPWAQAPIWPELQKEFSDRLRTMRDRGHTPDAMRAAAEADA